MAKGDEKELTYLGRYASPEAFYEAHQNARKRIDSGQIKTPLPENATAEQLAEYRKENGIPETPDKYDLTLPNGLVVGEADKPLVDSYLKSAHGHNWTPSQVKQGLEWYYSQQDQLREKQEEQDAEFKQTSTAELGKKYGGDFKRNVALVDTLLNEVAPTVKEKILGARLPNGRLAGSDPEFIDFLLNQAQFKYPIPAAIGGTSEAQIKTAQARQAELTKMSGDRNSAYWKGPQAKALQQEALDIIDGLEQLKQRRGGR